MDIIHYVRQHVNNWSTVFVRFPLVIAMAVMFCFYCSFQYASDREIRSILTMPWILFTGLTLISYLTAENVGWSKGKMYVIIGLLLILSIGYYFSIDPSRHSDWDDIRFLTLLLIIHLMVAVIPSTRKNNQTSFLRYNVNLLETFSISVLLSLILLLLLILAIYAIRVLFEKPFENDANVHLFIWIAGLVHTINFLSTMPKLPVEEQSLPVYNGRFYKVLVSYIGNPVILIYAIIILAFGVKLLIGGQYQPWITAMCGWYMVLGILAYLFNRLLLIDNYSAWSNFFNQSFVYFSVPVILLFGYCVQRNISEEGLTSPNYYSILLVLMATIILLLIAIKKEIHLKIVPLVLIIGAAFSILPGSFNVHNLIVHQQQNRLEKMMINNGCINDGSFDFNKPIDQSKLYKMEQSIYALGDDDLQYLKKYDKEKQFKDTITANDLLTKWRSPNAEVNIESQYYDFIPHYIPRSGEEIWPIVNQYINTPSDYKGLKILPSGLIGIYVEGQLSDSIAVLNDGMKDRKLTIQSMIQKSNYDIYIQNLSYRKKDSTIAIVDLMGLCIKK